MRRNDAKLLTLQISTTITSFSQFTKSRCNWELKSKFQGRKVRKTLSRRTLLKRNHALWRRMTLSLLKTSRFFNGNTLSSFSIGWNNNDSNLNMTLWFCGMSAGRRLSHPQNFVLGYVNFKIYQDPKWLFAIRLCYCIVTLFFLAGDIFQDAFPPMAKEALLTKNHQLEK